MSIRSGALFLLITFTQILEAQFIQEKNLQLLLSGTRGQYGIVPAGSDGIIMYNEIHNLESAFTRKWEITYLNSDLELQKRSYFESENSFKITNVKYYNGYVYLLFQDSNIPKRSVFFARAHITDDTVEFFEIVELLPREIVDFEILGNSLFLIGLDDSRPAILKFKYGNLRPQVLQGLYNENNELLNVSVLPGQEVIQIVTRLKKRQGKRSVLLIKQFDENAEIRKDLLIESSKGYHLIDGIANTDKNGRLCVVGTFSYKKSTMSDGIFTVVLDASGEHSLYYYAYANLHNYFDYLPAKELHRVKRKFSKEDERNRNFSYKDNQEVRELVKTGNLWTYIGEIVKVKKRNSQIYGNMWPMEYRQFSHAIILGIGEDGKLKWDNSLGMDEFITNSPGQQAHMNRSKNEHTLFYFQDGPSIKYKILNGNKNICKSVYEIEIPDIDFSNGAYYEYGNILPWYGNNFITFGSYYANQKADDDKRILFLSKISITTDYDVNNP